MTSQYYLHIVTNTSWFYLHIVTIMSCHDLHIVIITSWYYLHIVTVRSWYYLYIVTITSLSSYFHHHVMMLPSYSHHHIITLPSHWEYHVMILPSHCHHHAITSLLLEATVGSAKTKQNKTHHTFPTVISLTSSHQNPQTITLTQPSLPPPDTTTQSDFSVAFSRYLPPYTENLTGQRKLLSVIVVQQNIPSHELNIAEEFFALP